MAVLLPKKAANLISSKAKDVSINLEGIQNLSTKIYEVFKKGEYSLKSYKQHVQNPSVADEAALEWIFFADVLNFSFWSDDPARKYMVCYRGEECTGYWSLCAAMNRALDTGVPLTKASYFVTMSRDDWDSVFRSDSETPMPLVEERLRNLHDAGRVLLQKYGGSFVNVLKQCDRSAQKLLKTIVDDFPSFNDVVQFDGKTCAFFKRAQILIADIWACFEGQGLGTFDDIDTITMFADYRIPQALGYFGALTYSDELLHYLRIGELMRTGDRYEVELRGCSIHAVELIRDECQRLMAEDKSSPNIILNSVMIDHFLWDFRRAQAHLVDERFPMHKIRCIYY